MADDTPTVEQARGARPRMKMSDSCKHAQHTKCESDQCWCVCHPECKTAIHSRARLSDAAEQAKIDLQRAVTDVVNIGHVEHELALGAALDTLIAAVRAEMICPQCEAHGLPSCLIPK